MPMISRFKTAYHCRHGRLAGRRYDRLNRFSGLGDSAAARGAPAIDASHGRGLSLRAGRGGEYDAASPDDGTKPPQSARLSAASATMLASSAAADDN